MPFKSKAQVGKLAGLVKAGKLPAATFAEFKAATPSIAKLPERVAPKVAKAPKR